MPIQYLNHCQFIVNWTHRKKLNWIFFIKIQYIFYWKYIWKFDTTFKTNQNINHISFVGYTIHTSIICCWDIEAETKWPPLSRQHFQTHFLKWKYRNFNPNFTEILSARIQLTKKTALVQIMAWRRWGAEPLSEPMMAKLTDRYMNHLAL